MAEYIEREKAIRKTINSIVEILDIHNSISLTKIACKMRELPTADVVEVVFCKDCKHYTNIDTYRNPPRLDFHWCNKLGNITKENDYCSYGERRCEK